MDYFNSDCGVQIIRMSCPSCKRRVEYDVTCPTVWFTNQAYAKFKCPECHAEICFDIKMRKLSDRAAMAMELGI